MTCQVLEVVKGPSREELLNAFTSWFEDKRPQPVFHAIDHTFSLGEWRIEIIGLQMLDGEGRHFLISSSLVGTRRDLPVNWDESVLLEIKYDTRKRIGYMKRVR